MIKSVFLSLFCSIFSALLLVPVKLIVVVYYDFLFTNISTERRARTMKIKYDDRRVNSAGSRTQQSTTERQEGDKKKRRMLLSLLSRYTLLLLVCFTIIIQPTVQFTAASKTMGVITRNASKLSTGCFSRQPCLFQDVLKCHRGVHKAQARLFLQRSFLLSSFSSSDFANGFEDPSGPKPNERTYARQFAATARSEPVSYVPIGIASSPFVERHGAPRQPNAEGSRGQNSGSISMLPENVGGEEKARLMLKDLDGFSHVVVLSHLHLNKGWNPSVIPPRLRHLKKDGKKGVLSTRAPHRPNNIGMSVVKLHSVDVKNYTLHLHQTDLIDGTPILDIKPYIPRIDAFPTAKSGWVDDVERAEAKGDMEVVTHDSGLAAKEAARHRKSYQINALGKGNAVDVSTDTGKILRTDVPKKMGGNDSAAQPVEHLLTALVGCAQATATFVGRSMQPRILIDRIEFEMEAHRDERGALQHPIEQIPDIPARLSIVTGVGRVYRKGGGLLSEEELHLLGEQTEARCPVANMMMASGCVMDIQWVDGLAENLNTE